jgi:hypothetical protein
LTRELGIEIPKTELQQTNYPNGLKYPNFSKPDSSAKLSSNSSKPSSSKDKSQKKKFYPKNRKVKLTQEEYESYDEAEFNNDPQEDEQQESSDASAHLTRLAVNYSTIISPPPSPPEPEKAGESRAQRAP